MPKTEKEEHKEMLAKSRERSEENLKALEKMVAQTKIDIAEIKEKEKE